MNKHPSDKFKLVWMGKTEIALACANPCHSKNTHVSTGASDRSFYPIFNKRFDHLETLLTICTPKNVLSAWSLCGSLVPSPHSKCPKRTFMLPKSIMPQLQICYQSQWNVSCKTKNNINFMGQAWVRPPAKFWVKGFILPHKYHAPNFYQGFWHTLAISKPQN